MATLRHIIVEGSSYIDGQILNVRFIQLGNVRFYQPVKVKLQNQFPTWDDLVRTERKFLLLREIRKVKIKKF